MPPEYLASALWGLALLASFIGWGRWIATLLGVRERAYVGVLLAWGYAAMLAAGGWLCWLALAERNVLAALVGLGLSGFLLPRRNAPEIASDSTRLDERSIALHAGLAFACIGLFALSYAMGLFDSRYQLADDLGAYFLHAKKILETGSLYEPFSFRRMASYGGQSFLQALLLVVAPLDRVNLLDKGVCRLAVGIALLAYALTGPNRSLLAALVVSYAVGVYYDFATNTASLFSGVLAFAGLWMTLEGCRREPRRPIVNGTLTGLAVAATLPLRQNYGLACALIVLFEHVSRFRAAPGRYDWKELPTAAASAALCVGGWALLQLHSCGTPLFPLLGGFANPEWRSVLSARDSDQFLNSLRNFLGYPFAWEPFALCALSLALPRRSPAETSLRATAAAGLIAFGANAWLLAHAHPHEISRYVIAFLLPTILFASVHAAAILGRVRSRSALRDWRPWLCAVYLVALLDFLPPTTRLTERVSWLREALSGGVAGVPENPTTLAYERLQRATPAGAKLLVMLDRPHLLDLRRNDVVSLDLPGGVSPAPGLAQIESPREVVRYFRDLGYSWLGAVRPGKTNELYSAWRWITHAKGVRMAWQYDPSDVASWQVIGRTVVRFFEQLDSIAENCRVAHDDGTLLLIDLSHCRFGPERD